MRMVEREGADTRWATSVDLVVKNSPYPALDRVHCELALPGTPAEYRLGFLARLAPGRYRLAEPQILILYQLRFWSGGQSVIYGSWTGGSPPPWNGVLATAIQVAEGTKYTEFFAYAASGGFGEQGCWDRAELWAAFLGDEGFGDHNYETHYRYIRATLLAAPANTYPFAPPRPMGEVTAVPWVGQPRWPKVRQS